jgi:hypothetical protein
MAETVDPVDNRLPVILCSGQFGIAAKDSGLQFWPGNRTDIRCLGSSQKYLLPSELASLI